MHSILTSVVFPAPFGPSNPKSSPLFIARSRLSTALTEVKLRLNGLEVGFLVLNVFVRLIVWMAYSFCSSNPLIIDERKFVVNSVSVNVAIKFF